MSAACSMGFVLFFMGLAGFSPSVTRAGIMMLLYLGGFLLRREPDSLNSLGLAALVILFANPFAAADLGMLLSFSATAGFCCCKSLLRVCWSARRNRCLPDSCAKHARGWQGFWRSRSLPLCLRCR